MYAELNGQDIGQNKKCPFCASNVFHKAGEYGSLNELYVCPVCGKFLTDGHADLWINGLTPQDREQLYKVSFALRSIAETALGKRDNAYFPAYKHEDLARMLDAPDPNVQEKLNLLLRFLGRNTQYPGQVIEFDTENDRSVVCARNTHEAAYYFKTLVEQGLIREEAPFIGSYLPRGVITSEGWNRLESLTRQGEESVNGFIAMAFDPSRKLYGEAISEGIKAAGYNPIRIDQVEHVNRIDDEIIARIRSSKFLVADFTMQRNGVYFEAGFMLGLGRTVIWLCDKVELSQVHFDTRQYNMIDYENAEDLKKRLQLRIEALLGKGPVTALAH